MKRLSLVLCLMLLGVPAWSQPPEPQAAPPARQRPTRPREPEKQIQVDLAEFVENLNQGSFLGAARFVVDARMGFFGANEWFENRREREGDIKYQINEIQIDTLQNEEARVAVRFSVNTGRPEGNDGIAAREKQETLHLRRRSQAAEPRYAYANGLWGIVVDNTGIPLHGDPHSLQRCAFFVQQAPGMIPLMRREEAMHRLKNLGLRAMLFVQDYDEIFAFDAQYSQQAIMPYVRSTRIMTIPGTEERFAFNGRLSDRALNDIESPATTVMFYDGRDEQFSFRHNGQTIVCFADGHVAMLDADSAKNVRWEPGKTATKATAPAQ